jgi:hypothetical protein
MSPPPFENVLVIGDANRDVQDALAQALPNANVTAVASVFDGIAEMTANRYTTVLAAAEPIERRPEAAVKTLRQLAGESRLVMFGQSSLEPVSRKMLSFGLDDYIVTPATPGELTQIFGQPSLRVAPAHHDDAGLAAAEPTKISLLSGLPLADIVLDAILSNPQGGPDAAVKQINAHLGPSMQLHYVRNGGDGPIPPDGSITLSHAIRAHTESVATLHLVLPRDEEESAVVESCQLVGDGEFLQTVMSIAKRRRLAQQMGELRQEVPCGRLFLVARHEQVQRAHLMIFRPQRV